MNSNKYFIMYDWRAPHGTYVFCRNWSTNSLLKFICKFVYLSFKYEIINIHYRNYKE